MKEVLFLVEGQTEEAFVTSILAPYLFSKKIICTPVVVSTSKDKSGKKHKGGVINYRKVKNDILKLLKNKHAIVTTMIDYYGLPDDFPGWKESKKKKGSVKMAECIEKALSDDIKNRQFLPYIQMHEFEALLFSDKSGFSQILGFTPKTHAKFDAIFSQYKNPEEINDNPRTAPSKRIESAFPNYQKIKFGVLLSENITLPVMIKKCPHFKQWIENITKLTSQKSK